MEKEIVRLIALDRLDVPLSSMDQKLRRDRLVVARTLADAVGYGGYEDERVFARVEDDVRKRARGMKEAIVEFSKEFPEYGAILKKKIAEKREKRNKHLYFGVQEGSKLTMENYLVAIQSTGASEHQAHRLYPLLMDVSYGINRARDREERSIVVGNYEE